MAQMYYTKTYWPVKMFAAHKNPFHQCHLWLFAFLTLPSFFCYVELFAFLIPCLLANLNPHLEFTVYLLTFALGQKETEAGNGNRSLLFYHGSANIYTGY